MMRWNGPGSLLIINELVQQGGEISAALAEKMGDDFRSAAIADGRITDTEPATVEIKLSKKAKAIKKEIDAAVEALAAMAADAPGRADIEAALAELKTQFDAEVNK